MARALTIRTSPLAQFLDVPFRGDTHYSSIEIQRLQTERGSGMAILMNRRSGELDAYVDPVLGLDQRWFEGDPSIANLERGVLAERDFAAVLADGREAASLEAGDRAVVALARFKDVEGRCIDVSVTCRRPPARSRHSFFFPEYPRTARCEMLPFMVTREFWLIPRTGTSISVRIDGQERTPSPFPAPVGLRRRYHARFATGVSLAGFGIDLSARMPSDACSLRYGHREGRTVIEGASSQGLEDDLLIEFRPPIPGHLANTSRQPAFESHSGKVRFEMCGRRVGGGRYVLVRDAGTVELTLTQIDQNWISHQLVPSIHALTLMRRLTRRGRRHNWEFVAEGGTGRGSWTVNTLLARVTDR